jgi:hypothetical protein
MTVRNPFIGKASAKGCLGKAFLPRQRKLPNINHRLHADLSKPGNERWKF